MAHDFAKISPTAKLAAYMRQFSDIPFAAEIAELVQAREAFEALLHGRDLQPADLTWYAPLFEVRHKSINAMIRRAGARQVLELASGLSPRGLELTDDPAIRFIETDLPEATAEKRHVLTTLSGTQRFTPRHNLRIVTADALDHDQLQLAASQNFKSSQRLHIVHEGLLQYLSSSETEQVAHNVHHLLGHFGGAWITPDFSLKADAALASDQQKLFQRIVADVTERTLYNNVFENTEHLREYFRHLGFQVEVFNQLYLAPHPVSIERLNLHPDVLENLRPRLRLWLLTRL